MARVKESLVYHGSLNSFSSLGSVVHTAAVFCVTKNFLEIFCRVGRCENVKSSHSSLGHNNDKRETLHCSELRVSFAIRVISYSFSSFLVA